MSACRRCSNYIFILDLTPGFNGLGKDNCKTRRESFTFWSLLRLIFEILRYISIFYVYARIYIPIKHHCQQIPIWYNSHYITSWGAAMAVIYSMHMYYVYPSYVRDGINGSNNTFLSQEIGLPYVRNWKIERKIKQILPEINVHVSYTCNWIFIWMK